MLRSVRRHGWKAGLGKERDEARNEGRDEARDEADLVRWRKEIDGQDCTITVAKDWPFGL